jgi:hypothetical protein
MSIGRSEDGIVRKHDKDFGELRWEAALGLKLKKAWQACASVFNKCSGCYVYTHITDKAHFCRPQSRREAVLLRRSWHFVSPVRIPFPLFAEAPPHTGSCPHLLRILHRSAVIRRSSSRR